MEPPANDPINPRVTIDRSNVDFSSSSNVLTPDNVFADDVRGEATTSTPCSVAAEIAAERPNPQRYVETSREGVVRIIPQR